MHRERTRLEKVKGAILLVLFLLVAALPIVGLADGEAKEGAPAALTDLLARLDRALEELQQGLEEVDRPILEKELEEIASLLEGLIQELGAPPGEGERLSVKEEVVRLDLLLHRLVAALERFADRPRPGLEPSPAREKAKEAMADLRTFIDGYLAGATARMDRIEAREFERLARAMLEEIRKHLAERAREARGPSPEASRLEALVKEVQQLLARLDAFILRTFGPPPAGQPPANQPPRTP